MKESAAKLGRYHLQSVLGHGAAGEVHLAILHGPLGFRKQVAIKVLYPSFGGLDEQLRSDLINEARLGATLKHPNIVEMYELGEENSRLFIAMEYVDGFDVRRLLKTKDKLSPRAAVQILHQVCLGLDHAYHVQINGKMARFVHRDLKPSNLLLSRTGMVKIADFGLSRAIGVSDVTDRGRGTPMYMSPEQALGKQVDTRSDIFSLGAVFYELLQGKRLFDEQQTITIIVKLQKIEAQLKEGLLTHIQEQYPKLAGILYRMLRHSPEDRYSSIRELLDDLESLPEQQGQDLVAILQEEAVVQVQSIDSSVEFEQASLRTLPNLGSKLPKEWGGFVERVQIMDTLKQFLGDGNRFIVLKGPGGIGKSRLALRLAYMVEQDFEEVCFVSLHGAKTVTELCRALERQVEVVFPETDERSLIEATGQIIAGQGKSLFILDGFEALASVGLAAIRCWLHMAPEVTWLVTSRSALPIESVVTAELPPLSRAESLSLLQLRLQEKGGELTELSTIAPLLDCMEGIPLSLEIAAARITQFTIEEIVQYFTDAQQRLETRGISSAGDLISLGETIQFSWSLLRPWEQQVMLQLSIFQGDFDISAAEDVIDISSVMTAPMPVEVIDSLISQSLLRMFERKGKSRFEMSSSVREFIWAKNSAAIKQQLELRHAQHYASYASNFAFKQYTSSRRLMIEERSIEQAVYACIRRGWSSLAAQNGLALLLCWKGINLPYKGLLLLEELLSMTQIPLREHALLSTQMGGYLRQNGRYLESEQSLLMGLKAFDSLQDTLGRCDVLLQLSLSYADMGRYAEASKQLNKALDISLAKKDTLRQGICLRDQGYILTQQSKSVEAEQVLMKAAKILWSLKALNPIHQVMSNLGLIALRAERPEAAERYYRQALHVIRKAGLSERLDMIWMNLGICYVLQGKVVETEKCFLRAAKQMKKIGSYRNIGILYANWGLFTFFLGNASHAKKLLQEAKSYCLRFPHPTTEQIILHLTCYLAMHEAKYDAMRKSARSGLQLIDHHKFHFLEVECRMLYIEAQCRLGQSEKAVSHLQIIKTKGAKNNAEMMQYMYACGIYAAVNGQHTQVVDAVKGMQLFIKQRNLQNRVDLQFLCRRLQSEVPP